MMINILGTSYVIEIHNVKDDKELEKADGYCVLTEKRIVISDFEDWGDDSMAKDYIRSQSLRHEIIHAYLYESGLSYNSLPVEKWSMNEEMVDWLAIQFPKIAMTFEELNIEK